MGYKLFGSSVPNTYVAGVASLRLGWGGLKPDTFVRQEWIKGETTACECGLLKRKKAEGCFRCLSIDQMPGTAQALIVEALRDYLPATTYEIASRINRVTKTVQRNIQPLVTEGRVRTWLEDRDSESVSPEELAKRSAHHARLTSYVLSPIRVYQRVW